MFIAKALGGSRLSRHAHMKDIRTCICMICHVNTLYIRLTIVTFGHCFMQYNINTGTTAAYKDCI